MSRVFTVFIGIALLVAVVALLGRGDSARQQRNADEFVRTESDRLQALTVPADSADRSKSGLRREGVSAQVTWDFVTKMKWDEYRLWVSRQLASDFRVASEDSTRAVWTRNLNGDSQIVEVNQTGSASALRIRVVFCTYPD